MSQAEVLNPPIAADRSSAALAVVPLSAFGKGDYGIIVGVGDEVIGDSALSDGELERRLLELGFVEGASIELLHEGVIGRDPIAVRIDDMRVALRRREAASVLVRRTGRRG
jgi:ferrous iron transport protein A